MSLKIKFLKVSILLLSFLSYCYCQIQYSAEYWFFQAREYDVKGNDNLALKAYEKAYKQDPNSNILKDLVLMRYLRSNQFEKVLSIVKPSESIHFVDSTEYKDGDKIAEFYCRYVKDTTQAYKLWQKLIYNAVESHQLDSALILANSFAQNLPQYSVPRKMQTYLATKCKK